MEKETIEWMQLSDLHIFESTDWNLMMDGYKKLSKKLHPKFIVVTGDFRHKSYKENEDYSKTIDFLNEIVKIFNVEKEDVFLVPGNHDVEDYDYRAEAIDKIVSDIGRNPEIYTKYLKPTSNLYSSFCNYKKFVKNFYGTEVKDGRVSMPERVIALPWKDKINIILLNTALISDGNKNHDEIIDINAFSKIKIDNDLPTIVLGHHDFKSICKSHAERMKRIFGINRVKAYLCGDTHREEIKYIDKYDNEKIPCIICGKSAVEITDDYSDVGVIEYYLEEDGYTYVRPYKWGEKYSFIKADNFLYDIDKDFRFPMLDHALPSFKTSFEFNIVSEKEQTDLLPTKTYMDITDAHKDIAKDIKEGGFLSFYGLRGATFLGTSEVNVIVRELKNNPNLKVKFLISYPFSEEVRHRLKNIPEFASSDKCEEKWRDTYKKVEDLRYDYKTYSNVSIRFHDNPIVLRFLFTKKHLYLGYYEPGKNSVNTKIYQLDCNSPAYRTYSAFFDYQWKKARHYIPSKIPSKYSFLAEKFSVHPSLVVNVTSQCNMHCVYCPTGGENLKLIKHEECLHTDSLKKLIFAFEKCIREDKGESIIRITGGEPLIDTDSRKKTAVILDTAKKYKKIVLCTNAIYLKDAYIEHEKEWNAVKNNLLLKISLDTLNPKCFNVVTGLVGNEDKLFEKVIDNIKFAKNNGFKIELNFVATKFNFKQPHDIIDLFEFAKKLGLVGVKILTVNDFGGMVEIEQSTEEQDYINGMLEKVIQYMRDREYEEKEMYLNDNKGIQMRRFISVSDKDEKCTLTIVDHHNSSHSITPRRTFSEFCNTCKYFLTSDSVMKGLLQPCATGIMSLTLRADGILSPCRLCTDRGVNIGNVHNSNNMERIVKNSLKAFENCFHMNM